MRVTVEHGGHSIPSELSRELFKLILQGVVPCEGRQQYGGSQAQLIGSNLHTGMAVGVSATAIQIAIQTGISLNVEACRLTLQRVCCRLCVGQMRSSVGYHFHMMGPYMQKLQQKNW